MMLILNQFLNLIGPLPLKKEETKCNFKGCDCKEYHNRDKN